MNFFSVEYFMRNSIGKNMFRMGRISNIMRVILLTLILHPLATFPVSN